MIRRSSSVASNSPKAKIQGPSAALRLARSISQIPMNQTSALSLVTTAGNPTASSSVTSLLQYWLPFSEPLPILPIPAPPQNSQSSAPVAAGGPNAAEKCIPHVIAAASAAELHAQIIEQAVSIAVASASRLTLTLIANPQNPANCHSNNILPPDSDHEQQIRLKLAQTDYRTLQHGLQITPPVNTLGDIQAHLCDSSPLTILLISRLDLTNIHQHQHSLSLLLQIPRLAILAAELANE